MSHAAREFATEIVQKLREAGFIAYFAGGCVRDLLLGRPPKDYDVATTAQPEQVRDLFGKRRTLAVGASFGVIVVLGPKAAGPVEVATFRTEGDYTDGRRPDRVAFCTPEEDASRRDFTINGMFYDPIESRVLDYVGGEQDLQAGVIRAIGDPHDRMREDKLRMLRAVRFAATLDFQLDQTTFDAVRDMAEQLTVVSAERITQELKRMLVDPHRRRAMKLCLEGGLLEVILPELLLTESGIESSESPCRNLVLSFQMLHLLQEPRFELALAALLHSLPAEPTIRNICLRLKLSNEEKERTLWLVSHQDELLIAPTFSLARLKRLLAHSDEQDLLSLLRVKLLAREADLHPVLFCEEFLARMPVDVLNPPPLISGNDLIQHGIAPGPRFKSLLETVRDAQLNGEICTAVEALALVQRLQQHQAGGKP